MPEKGLVKILTDKCSVALGRGGTKRHEECGGIVIEQKRQAKAETNRWTRKCKYSDIHNIHIDIYRIRQREKGRGIDRMRAVSNNTVGAPLRLRELQEIETIG